MPCSPSYQIWMLFFSAWSLRCISHHNIKAYIIIQNKNPFLFSVTIWIAGNDTMILLVLIENLNFYVSLLIRFNWFTSSKLNIYFMCHINVFFSRCLIISSSFYIYINNVSIYVTIQHCGKGNNLVLLESFLYFL